MEADFKGDFEKATGLKIVLHKKEKNMGFNFAGNRGFEICFMNGYVVSIQPFDTIKGAMFDSMYVNVLITKVISKDEIENRTIDIMERLEYRPQYQEMKRQMFLQVEPHKLTKILCAVNNMEVQ
jgi:hypothetical protein